MESDNSHAWFASLLRKHEKILRKLERCGFETDLQGLSRLRRDSVSEIPGFGQKSVILLDRLVHDLSTHGTLQKEDTIAPLALTDEVRARHDWILRKLMRMSLSTTIDDIRQLDASALLQRPGFGPKAAKLLRELQLECQDTRPGAGSPGAARYIKFSEDIGRVQKRLGLTPVGPRWRFESESRKFKRAWTALSKSLNREPELEDLLNLRGQSLEVPSLTTQRRRTLHTYADSITAEISRVAGGLQDALISSSQFRWETSEVLDSNSLDLLLVEHIEDFVYGAEGKDYELLTATLGFCRSPRSLRELAVKYEVSHQAISLRRKVLISRLREGFLLNDKSLRSCVEEAAQSRLSEVLPRCANAFNNDDNVLVDALEVLTHIPGRRPLRDLQLLPAKFPVTSIFTDYVERNPSPLDRAIFQDYLGSEHGLNAVQIYRFEQHLLAVECVASIEPFRPRNLSPVSAGLHILAGVPGGLHWKDIAQVCEHKGLSRGTIRGTTLHRVRGCAPYGRGILRHERFFSTALDIAPSVMAAMRTALLGSRDESLPLERFRGLEIEGHRPDYWEIRYITSRFGEGAGIYFMGQSGVDTVALSPNASPVKNADKVVRILDSSDRALTIPEIVPKLRARSVYLLKVLIHQLQKSGRVIRVSRTAYWTPSRALKGLDVEEIKQAIAGILADDPRPIEAGLLRDRLVALGYPPFGKQLYRHLAKDVPGAYLVRNLLADSPIRYRSLGECLDDMCDPTLPTETNITRLEQVVRITRTDAMSAIHNWKPSQGEAED